MKDGGQHREKFCNRIPCNADCRDTFANFPLSCIESNERGEEVGEGRRNRRIRRPQIQKINLLNSLVKRIEGSLEFSSFALKNV